MSALFLLFTIAAAEPTPVVDLDGCTQVPGTLPAGLEEAKKATLSVRTPEGFGAAVLVHASGTALTAAHVVGTQREVTVRTAAGLELGATVTWVDAAMDLAVLDVEGRGHACVTAAKEDPKTGSDAYALGTPADTALAFSVSKGVVSGIPTVEGRTWIQTDASVNPGNSGGPLLDSNGHLIGVVTWKMVGQANEGLGFAIPSSRLRKTLDTELEGGIVSGVVGGVISNDTSTYRPSGRSDLVHLNFSATQPGVTIGLANDNNISASSQYGNFAFTQTQVKDLCIAPCSVDLPVGVHNLIAYGEKVEPIRHKVDLRPGSTRNLSVKPRPAWVSRTAVSLQGLGATTALVGASLWGTSALISGSGGGAPGLTRAGVGMTVAGGLGLLGGIGIKLGTKPSWSDGVADVLVAEPK